MNLTFERNNNTTNEWYTPPHIIRSLGEFDLDPCTSEIAYAMNKSAKCYYTKDDDGLSQEWFGRVWLNPPYSNPTIYQFIEKMAAHNNGIALLFNRCDNKMFRDIIFPNADSIFFLSGRIHFFREDGKKGGQPGCGSIFVAFGEDNTESILNSGLRGELMIPYKRKKIGIQQQLF